MDTTAIATIASDIPGASAALRYIADKLRDFAGTESRIRQAQHKAAQLSYIAKQQGDTNRVYELDDQIGRLGALAQKRAATADMLKPVTDWLQQNGFGFVLPVIIAVAAVTAVTAVSYVLSQTAVEEQKLDLLAKGMLTPEQLADLNRSSPGLFNFDFGKVIPWAIGGFAAWKLWGWLQGKGRGSRVWH